jgi:23S rRNA (uracil1939-C5)-methyltransferase
MRKNEQNLTISFKVDHIDPLGQGVYKNGENIYFIPKTLPSESGTARIVKKNKKIHFCEVIEITEKSPQRIEAQCPHYQDCGGCHFLHTSYENEIEFKTATFQRMIQKYHYSKEIKKVVADQRLHYRNRVQLHYAHHLLGFKKYKSSHIQEIPQCKIAVPEVTEKIQELYQKKSWKNMVSKKSGHIELYQYENQVHLNIDDQYAKQGFTQVNQSMNQKIHQFLDKTLNKLEFKNAIDLFGGNGNLSQKLQVETDVIDLYTHQKPQTSFQKFINFNLYLSPLDELQTKLRSSKCDLFILDPPRSGFQDLAEYTLRFRPKFILYISCHPQTMVRDCLSVLDGYEVMEAGFFDLFPSTYHLEGYTLLQVR